jgi:hypothetical protein
MSEFARIELSQIAILPGRDAVDEMKVGDIVESFLTIGQKHPILVRHNGRPEIPGKYLLVFGEHRKVAAERLGWTEIAARVEELTDDQAEAAEITEDLRCSPPKSGDHDRALARWKELYFKLHPETAIDVSGGRNPDIRGDADSPKAAAFRQVAARQLGITPRAIDKAILRGTALTKEERDRLDEKGIKVPSIDKIASIVCPQARSHAIKLILDGAKPRAAMQRAAHSTDVMAEPTLDARPAEFVPEELSFEEWLDSLPIREKVVTAVFDRDAKFYFDLRKARQTFCASIAKFLKQKPTGPVGRYRSLVARLFFCKHPRQWLICSACDGCGMKKGQPTPCDRCWGGGYIIG